MISTYTPLIGILLAALTACSESSPDAVDECEIPSACGARQYCDAAQTAICVRSAEGVNRCGSIPSSCHVELCQTSADCATLGPEYFCDTPNSGCCTDPPQELPRCIAAFTSMTE